MDRYRSHTALWRRFLRLLAVLPLVLMALVPSGVMSGEGRDGQQVLVLCSGEGPVRMVLDPETGTLKKAPAPEGKAGCDWAGAQAVPDLVQPIAILRPLRPVVAVLRPVMPRAVVARYRPAGLGARGPPIPM